MFIAGGRPGKYYEFMIYAWLMCVTAGKFCVCVFMYGHHSQ